jgi:hypothetical protein
MDRKQLDEVVRRRVQRQAVFDLVAGHHPQRPEIRPLLILNCGLDSACYDQAWH